MKYEYTPRGVCSRKIYIDIDDNDVIEKVAFDGGSSGNTQGLAEMVRGLNAKEVVERLKGIKCGLKNTSCPDQLAIAIEEILNRK